MKQTSKLLALILAVAMIAALAGCSGAPASSDKAPQTSQGAGGTPDDSVVVDPLAKYDPPITITTVAQEGVGLTFAEGQDWENNYWTQMSEPETGINVDYAWVAPTAQYTTKLNLSISTGDIPDFFAVNGNQLKDCVAGGIIMEMGPIIEKYQAQITKETLASDPYAIKSATFDGKVMAFPSPGSPVMGGWMVYYRSDWAENLGLAEPKTLQDLLAMSTAFAKNDPDGNGQNDTFGFSFDNGLGPVYNFAAMYHAYPQIWRLDENGNAVYGAIQPVMKQVLTQLHTMYANGEIDPEFGVKDWGKFAESLAAGKVGIMVDSWFGPFNVSDNIKNDPNAMWKVLPLLSGDSEPAKAAGHFSTGTYYVVNKNCKNPEAVVMYINWLLDKYYVKKEVVSKPEWGDHQDAYGYSPIWIEPPEKNLVVQQNVKRAILANSEEGLTDDEINNWKIQKTFDTDRDPFGFAIKYVFGAENASLDIIQHYKDNNLVEQTIYNTAPTERMAEVKPNLDKMVLETYIKIIMGEYPIEQFDTFVADWKKAGGDEITAQVDEWYKANK